MLWGGEIIQDLSTVYQKDPKGCDDPGPVQNKKTSWS